jgi:predicted RNA-binding Zn-ribbon protein involved in translation (DUF1610 family)
MPHITHQEMRSAIMGQWRHQNGAGSAPPADCVGLLYVAQQEAAEAERAEPIAMRLLCPSCGELHVDEGAFATKAHHTHACQACGNVWRPAIVATVGVRFLPGFKNEGR